MGRHKTFPPCLISGCPKRARGHGWCSTHYTRWRKTGDPLGLLPPNRKPPPLRPVRPKRERWEEHVQRASEPDGCWIWQGSRGNYGYGQLRTGDPGKLERAHRLAWEFYRGSIPIGLQVLHRCDNPPCVNPDHLFIGTPRDNAADRQRKGRQNRKSGDLRHRVPHGEQMGRAAHLTTADVIRIRERVAAGESRASVARDFPISAQQVGSIVARKSWSHIP